MVQSADNWQSAEQLENSVDYQALLLAAAGKPARSMGSAVIPAEPPQWKEVLKLAEKLQVHQPAHVNILANVIKAETHLRGFAGLRSSLQTALDTLEANWTDVLPTADEDVPEDPFYGRVNILRELEQPAFLDCLYRIPLVSVRAIGEFSTRDIGISAGNVQADDDEKERCQAGLIKAAFEQVELQSLNDTSAAIDEASQVIRSLVSLFTRETGQTDLLSLDGLRRRLAECQSRFMEFAENRLEAHEALQPTPELVDQGNAESVSVVAATSSASGSGSTHGSLKSREDAVASLSAIIAYYRRWEPSSPVLVLACRAQELIPQSYFEVLQQLAPGHQSSFAELMQALVDDPLAFLIEDSYQRFVNGEKIPAEVEPDRRTTDDNRSHDSTDESLVAIAESPDSSSPARLSNNAMQAADQDQHIVNSRQDAVVLLAEIERYFRHTEPSSPIPLLMTEMQKLVPKTFADLIVQYAAKKPGSAGDSVAVSGNSD